MDIVSRKLGIFLRKEGFNGECNVYRWNLEYKNIKDNKLNTERLHFTPLDKDNHNDLPSRVSAPSYFQVLEWLRKKHFIHIYSRYQCSVNEVLDFYYNIDFMINSFKVSNEVVKSIDMDEEKTLIQAITLALTKIKTRHEGI